ncbi:TRAPP subunit TRS20 NDAI_0E03540 [Naumovozyma dairenensis CBS 421]|uniref:Trafficking protein particle complex subunit n=1 Tax=Naumovozyma dairenensis (strain ATCC 10597 / BCRC 20456 / CBS 421 / NBRC 0211 / NRRL Y-12639) TaxID=1071378 RepID=G0WBQ1_NAUDC|nr:hypothetical protein NDAI_0E03540 [Naumovozyma dairenensis CBS 421]CCD25171.1 hypothetical protein NDAI_0E03540 [Naumovozyma dairenensis CBS 421]
MPQYFAIIGTQDNPIYEAEFTNPTSKNASSNEGGFPNDLKELNPFILHAALDVIEDLQWQPNPTVNNANGGGGIGIGYFNSNTSSNSSLNSTGFLKSRTSLGGNNSASDNCYLGKVDHFYGLSITAYLTYNGMKFVMIHGDASKSNTNEKDITFNYNEEINSKTSNGNRNKAMVPLDDNAIRSFYQEVHELYIKALMNPFYNLNDPINDSSFDMRVRRLAKKYIT